ncbi:hypothetical protein [Rhizobium sp. NFACC06-2]|uniref:hypothetical protein n=1 Tax=Rhizobium sp. NFACC06-2 TaxID=1566264 RepID=UPI0008773C1A|nr:hypothetical protein [Rhizobium sp. NFACC06-2]SCY92335.1 hypothetical protein SAMN03159288_05267 [Rhizobium sp. NFACC06-2]
MDASEDISNQLREMALGDSGLDDHKFEINEMYMKVYISQPKANGEDYYGRRPRDFGPVSRKQAETLLIELLDSHGNLIPATLLDQHMWNKAGTEKLKWADAKRLAQKILSDQNIPVYLNPERVSQGKFVDDKGVTRDRYTLQGEEQFQEMGHGVKRLQQVQHMNRITTGDTKTDYQVIFENITRYSWRKEGDGLTVESILQANASKDENGRIVGVPIVAITSTSNASHSSGFIDLHKDEWGTADKRLKGRTFESVSEKLGLVYVTFENQRQVEASAVLRLLPESRQARKLLSGPGDKSLNDIPINVRSPYGNNLEPIERLYAKFPEYVKAIARDHGMYAGSWAKREPDEKGQMQLAKEERKALLERYKTSAPASVAFKGAFVSILDQALLEETRNLTPEARQNAYPPSSILLTLVSDNGNISGSQRVMSSFGDHEHMPEHGFDSVRSFYAGEHIRTTPALTLRSHAPDAPDHIRNALIGGPSSDDEYEMDDAHVGPGQADMMGSFQISQQTPTPAQTPDPRVYDSTRENRDRDSGHGIL